MPRRYRRTDTGLEPFDSQRLARLAIDLRQVTDLAEVGPDGKERLAAAIEYIDAIVEVRRREAVRRTRLSELARVTAYQKARRKAVRI